MHKKNLFFKKGSLSVELLIATVVIVIALVTATVSSGFIISASRQTLRQTQTSFLLEEGAEVVKIIRNNSWSNISGLQNETNYYLSFSGSSWSITTTPNTVGNFTRKIIFHQVLRNSEDDIVFSNGSADSGTRKVTIEVSWNEGQNTKTKNLEFYITNITS